jgi:NAD(P)-dependent dehydrogenase (short-subunit alcohol dehydrogenase family)
MSELAVVTGAGTGIGRATAELLAGRGLHVVLVGRTASTLDETHGAISSAGGTAQCLLADIGVPEDVDGVVSAIGGRPIKVVVHAAGCHIPTTFAQTTRADFDRQVDVNLTGPFFLTQGLAPSFVDGGSIVFVSSMVAERARDLHVAYAAAKAGLLALTKHLAAELAPLVRVNCVSPGATATAMLKAYVTASTKDLTEDERQAARLADSGRSRLLLRRVAQPAEVASTIVHLALDATAVTGVDVAVDLGYKAS